jgi:hypothetical protein
MRIVAHAKRFDWRSIPGAAVVCAAILCALALSGCATAPDEMIADNVSPAVYESYDCDQLAVEIVYLGDRVRDLYELLAVRRKRDEWQAGFSWFYGITAFFLDGDGPEAQEYRQLLGQFEAARVQALKKQCGFEASTPEEIIANAISHLETGESRSD